MVISLFYNLLGNQEHFDIDIDNLCDPNFVKKIYMEIFF
jgi:hypothetical protein